MQDCREVARARRPFRVSEAQPESKPQRFVDVCALLIPAYSAASASILA